MKLIVGLGNPGREYVGTRHNVGFDVVDEVAERLSWIASAADFDRLARTKFSGLALDGTVTFAGGGGSEKVLLLKPTTYMNLSGRSVQEAMAFHKLTPADLMVVLDEMALPCGKIRLRSGGSSGGHNGLKDIERALGTSQYPRLRVGVDAPPGRVPGRDYVLGRFTEAQLNQVVPAVQRATSAVIAWAEKGMNAAMNVFNADKEKK